jgi:hypothetical protein
MNVQEEINIFLSTIPRKNLENIIILCLITIAGLLGFVIGDYHGQYTIIEKLKDYYSTKSPLFIP